MPDSPNYAQLLSNLPCRERQSLNVVPRSVDADASPKGRGHAELTNPSGTSTRGKNSATRPPINAGPCLAELPNLGTHCIDCAQPWGQRRTDPHTRVEFSTLRLAADYPLTRAATRPSVIKWIRNFPKSGLRFGGRSRRESTAKPNRVSLRAWGHCQCALRRDGTSGVSQPTEVFQTGRVHSIARQLHGSGTCSRVEGHHSLASSHVSPLPSLDYQAQSVEMPMLAI